MDQGSGPDEGRGVRPAPHLRALPGGGPVAATDPAQTVQLRREFKGVTVEELTASPLAEQLPSRLQKALRLIERGDLGGAEAALPGRFGTILAGPGVNRAARRRRWLWCLVPLAGAVLWWWWSA